MKRYNVISLHPTTECNLNCPMCYRPKTSTCKKSFQWFKDLIPYLAELTNQVAIGGGEPFLYPEFIKEFSKEAKESGLITNVTTNGTLPMKEYVKDVEMVSISYDAYKYNLWGTYKKSVDKIRGITRIGCNLLIETFGNYLLYTINRLFDGIKVERVFALYPKNWRFIDILRFKPHYYALTFKYKHFYVDDLTNQILKENKYSNWKTPCHYGKSIISINERGYVTGCSFDKEDKALIYLNEPEDLLKVKEVKVKERFSCPHLNLK